MCVRVAKAVCGRGEGGGAQKTPQKERESANTEMHPLVFNPRNRRRDIKRARASGQSKRPRASPRKHLPESNRSCRYLGAGPLGLREGTQKQTEAAICSLSQLEKH